MHFFLDNMSANYSFSGLLGSRVGLFCFVFLVGNMFLLVANGVLALRVNVPLENLMNRSFCRF